MVNFSDTTHSFYCSDHYKTKIMKYILFIVDFLMQVANKMAVPVKFWCLVQTVDQLMPNLSMD